MTIANGRDRNTGSAALAALRRCAVNIAAAIKILVRPPRIHPRPSPVLIQRLLIGAAIAVAVFLLGMFFVDAAASRAAKQLPKGVVWFFQEITDFGMSGWFLWPLGILFLVLVALPRNALTPVSQRVLAAVTVRVGFLFVAIGLPSVFATIIKRVIGRARPGVSGVLDPTLFSPFKWTAAYAGMPSGHATTAFAVLAAVVALWPRARTVALIYALLIATSRVVINAHYPTDVLAGALVGIVGVLMVRHWFALRRLAFSVGLDGILHEYPGPSGKRIKKVARELSA